MQARLRAQLGDWSKYSGERRRRSVVVASIVDHNRPSTRLIPSLSLSPSCAHSPFLLFFSASVCFQCVDTLLFASNLPKRFCMVGTRYFESTEKVEKRDFRAVGNGILWLTPCKLACERSLETGPNIVASVGDGRSWWHQ